MRRLAVNPEPVRHQKSELAVPQPETPTPIGTMNQAELAKHLGKNQSNISRNRKKGRSHFREWSKRLDPDGIAWDSDDELPAVFFKVKELE